MKSIKILETLNMDSAIEEVSLLVFEKHYADHHRFLETNNIPP